MKQTIKSKASKEELMNGKQKDMVNKNHLYSLLFAGRISLKEYLHKIKEDDLQQHAA